MTTGRNTNLHRTPNRPTGHMCLLTALCLNGPMSFSLSRGFTLSRHLRPSSGREHTIV